MYGTIIMKTGQINLRIYDMYSKLIFEEEVN